MKPNHIIKRSLFILIAAALLLLSHSARADDIFTPRDGRAILIVAHRGANWAAPQNTLPAMRKAIQMKADFVECDVRTTKDGHLVIMHDSEVSATTDGKGKISDLTLEEIRKLDAGFRKGPKFKNTKVPTFDEMLQTASGSINIYLDWKDASSQAISAALEKSGMSESTVVYGGVAELMTLQAVNKKVHPMPSLNTREELEAALKSGLKFDALASDLKSFKKDAADLAHTRGIKVFLDVIGPGDSCEGIKKALELGADAIQTDMPDRAGKCLKKN